MSQMDESQCYRRSAVLGALASIYNPALQLIVMPLVFKKLGSEVFGVWVMIAAVIAASSIANLGLGEATVKYVALQRANGHIAGVSTVLRTTLSIYLLLGIAACLCLFLSATVLATSVFNAAPALVADIALSLRIGGLAMLLRFWYAVWEAGVRGHDRYDLEALVSIGTATVTSIGSGITVYMGGGLPALVFVNTVSLGLGCIAMGLALRRVAGNFDWFRLGIDRAEAIRELKYGMFTWIQTINGIVTSQLDRLVIGVWLNASAAGYYAVSMQVVQTGHSVLARAGAFVFPLAVRHSERGHAFALKELFSRGMILTTLAGWAVSGGLVFFGPEILALWMGDEFASHATPTLIVLAVWGCFMASSVIPFYYLNAVGGERLNAGFGVLSTSLFLVSTAALIPCFGIVGAAFGRVISLVTSLVTRVILYRRCFPEQHWSAGPMTLAPTAIAMLIALPMLHTSLSSFPAKLALYLSCFMVCTVLCRVVYKRFNSAQPMPTTASTGITNV